MWRVELVLEHRAQRSGKWLEKDVVVMHSQYRCLSEDRLDHWKSLMENLYEVEGYLRQRCQKEHVGEIELRRRKSLRL